MEFSMGPLAAAMMEYERGVPARIHHFLKVYAYAKLIGEQEKISPEMQKIVEAAAIVHDCGIRPSLEKYQSSGGKFQEMEGPSAAREILEQFDFTPDEVERICFLVSKHHTYQPIEGEDHQILIEADFLVNLYEGKSTKEAILKVRDHIFKTQAGIQALNDLFGLLES